MAVNTWVGGDSGNETDYGTAANWNTTGETNRVPTDADDVIIPKNFSRALGESFLESSRPSS